MIEYWIEYALTEQSVTRERVNAGDLVEQLSSVAWGTDKPPDDKSDQPNWSEWDSTHSSDTDITRFLKEFRDAPHRSEQARSFVDKFCEHVLRWFAAASAEGLKIWYRSDTNRVARWGGEGFIRAASFVGHLIEWGLFSYEFTRRHLVKPLIAIHYTDSDVLEKFFRPMAIYQLFVVARDTLLQGLLGPEDIQACFKALDAEVGISITLPGGLIRVGPDAAKIKVQCSDCPGASHPNLLTD